MQNISLEPLYSQSIESILRHGKQWLSYNPMMSCPPLHRPPQSQSEIYIPLAPEKEGGEKEESVNINLFSFYLKIHNC